MGYKEIIETYVKELNNISEHQREILHLDTPYFKFEDSILYTIYPTTTIELGPWYKRIWHLAEPFEGKIAIKYNKHLSDINLRLSYYYKDKDYKNIICMSNHWDYDNNEKYNIEESYKSFYNHMIKLSLFYKDINNDKYLSDHVINPWSIKTLLSTSKKELDNKLK